MLDSQNLEETIKQLQSSGILFCIEFVGSVIIEKSINSLSADKQTQFARACMKFVINKVISSNDTIDADLESIKYLNLQVQTYKNDVELNISSSAFIIIDTTTMCPLHRFNIQDISLFSPGFDEFSTFFCFFAKDQIGDQAPLRRCFVFNAQEELEDVRDAIYFAFKLNEHNKNVTNLKENGQNSLQNRKSSIDDLEYVESINDCEIREDDSKTPIPCQTPPTPICNEQKFFDSNSLNGNNENSLKLPPELPPRKSRHSLSNDVSTLLKVSKRGRSESNFDDGHSFRLSIERLQELTTDLSNQKWFHGLLTREESDPLLCENGQFFVRNSPTNPNRFVLVGMHNGKVVHIRLLNNEGKLQTTAGEFKNIVNFINYFYHSRLPVIVDEKSSPILLHFPINRR
ncbi:hypothetical protein ACQ4LE_010162 [Meloidogyne hapla]|uniref:SH2 domain-containing protein n=1 Tax=Meloidogyne hapla TaxID=6305 RepID=A0A1I8C103_MELHA